MAPRTTKRRSPGEGGAYKYKIRTTVGPDDKGVRWYWKAVVRQPDGTTRQKVVRGFETKKAAQDAMREALLASSKGGYAEPSRQPFGAYLATWLDGLRLAPATVASYRKNVRLHVAPRNGAVPLASVTPARLNALYRELERGGRADHRAGEGLSARTVRYIHTIISAALRDAVNDDLLPRNPAAKASPPTAKQAVSPEMQPWTAGQLAAFLGWAREHSELYPAWHVLAMTGMRRGELLALRWRDIDLPAGTIAVRRSAGVVRNAGQGAEIREGSTKTGQSRVIDIDAGTVAVLRAHRKDRGTLALALARDDSVVFGDLEGGCRHPERFSRRGARRSAGPSGTASTCRRSGCTTCGTRTRPCCCRPTSRSRRSASGWATSR